MLCADPSTVSRQVASLVKAGLVERQADPDDGRASILVPTELGRAKVREHSAAPRRDPEARHRRLVRRRTATTFSV